MDRIDVQPQERIETRLLAAAERLFAEHGLDGVSLRQIATAAGSSNNVVVQYHFGSKRGLVQAIFEWRLPSLEARCGQLLFEAQQADRLGDPRALLEVLLRPLAEERDETGQRRYVAFLVGLYHFEGSFALRREVSHLAPVATLVGNMLHATVPLLPRPLFLRRMAAAADTVHRAIVDHDRELAAGIRPLLSDARSLDDALDVATAIVTAPVAPGVLADAAARGG